VEFKRARSDEQREVRRQAILHVAADMVATMPVAELSLNELSRRVGLAKSNVLRYFESREAVLLELLDSAWRDWLARLGVNLARGDLGTAEGIARAIRDSIVDDRLLCELLSVSAAVLERNVSPEVARRYKVSAIANTQALADLVRSRLPGLSPEGGTYFAGGTLVSITGLWPLTQPSEAMLCVYEDPDMAALRIDFGEALYEMLATLLVGCLARWPVSTTSAAPARAEPRS
jgi:AcrR family transcriptional regulator